MTHLVDRAIASAHPDGRIAGVMHVPAGIVVGIPHMDGCAFGQKNGLAITVNGLAIDVPTANQMSHFFSPFGRMA